MVNRVILAGNLTRDPETTAGPATTMARMRVATNAVWNDSDGVRQQSTEYHNVVAFGGVAATCAQYLRRGRRVYVEGRLRTREYQATDGSTRRSTEVVADTVQFLDRPPQAADGDAEEAGATEAAEPVAGGAAA